MKTKFFNAISLAVIFAMLVTSLALADDVSNNLDLTVDASLESTALIAGGVTKTVDMYIVPLGSDGKPGCNLTGSTTLVVDVVSSSPAVASVSPTQITFTNCEPILTNLTTAVTVTPVSIGSTTISLSLVTNTTTGSFNLAPASFTVNVKLAAPSGLTANGTSQTTVHLSWNDNSTGEDNFAIESSADGISFSPLATVGAGATTYDDSSLSCATTRYYRVKATKTTPTGVDSDYSNIANGTTYSCAPVDSSAPVISYVLTPLSPDGSNGWYKSNVTLVWSVTDDESAVSKTGCVDQNIIADQLATDYSCSATSAGGSAGPVTVTIKRDATAPSVTVSPNRSPDYGAWYNELVSFTVSGADATSGVAGCDADFDYSSPDSATASVNASCTDNAGNEGNGSYNFMYDGTVPEVSYDISPARPASGWWNIASGAPTATFTCSDATAEIESCTDPYTFGEGENQNYTGEAKDNAGNTASVEVTNIDVDLTAPIIAYVSRTAANGYGWNNGPVTVEWSCSDDGSGVVNASVFSTVSTEGENQSTTGTCEDLAGNTTSNTQSGINIDKTVPTASASVLPAANANGWNNTNVTVSFSGNDGTGSGIASCSAAVVLSSDGAGQLASGTCTDKAGNVSADTTASGINIDKTAPVFGACPAVGPFILNSGLQAIGPISVNADFSGLNTGASTLSGSVDTSSIGLKTINFTAVDNADNSATKPCSYSVIYNWNGFFQPIDNNMLNVSKAGSAIPVKFSLSGNQGLNIFAVGYPSSKVVACGTSAEDAIETTVTAGSSSLSYDVTADQYIYVWKTDKAWAGTCRTLVVKLSDGTFHYANFKFTK